ncbi:hypothetical protein EMIT043CA1_210042 [Pseudomonas brassicacearum]
MVMHPVTLCVTFQKRNAERPWRHSHAECEERSKVIPLLKVIYAPKSHTKYCQSSFFQPVFKPFGLYVF